MPRRRWRLAHLVALSSLAVTGPVLDVLGANPTFFVAHDAGPAAVALTALLAVVAVPLVLGAVALGVGLVSPAWGWRVHVASVALLATLIASNLLDDLVALVIDDLPQVSGPVGLALAVAAGLGLTRAYLHRPLLRSTLSALVVVPVLFVAVFAFASPAHDLLFPPSVAAADVTIEGVRPPIVVVVFDELPLATVLDREGDAIDADRFPHLARLAGDGTWYPNATAVAAYTHEAVPAILSGALPADANLPPTVSGHPDTLFTLLADDYAITAHEQLTELCPPSLCDRSTGADADVPTEVLLEDLAVVGGRVTLPAVLDGLLPEIDDTWAFFGQDPIALDREADRARRERDAVVDDLGASDRVARFERAAGDLEVRGADADEPALTFLHTIYPHAPWSHLDDGTPYPAVANLGLEDGVWATEAAIDLGWQRHLLQAEHADRLLGTVLARLEALGAYDDALVVVTADHGAAFTPGVHRRAPAPASLAGLMPVPLVVKAPGGAGPGAHVDDRQARSIDVLPTIADLLDVDLPFPVDGRSLFGPEAAPVERGIYARGETVPAGRGPVDPGPLVDRLWDRFGVDGRLRPYGRGPGATLVGEWVAAHRVDEPGAPGCWAPAEDGEGRGYRWGRVEGLDDERPVGVVLAVGGEVVGAAETYGEEHELLALGDPARWPRGAEAALWRLIGGGLARLPHCR